MQGEIIEIKDEDRLLRRTFYKDPSYVRDDMTVTSFAFKLRKGEAGLSVDIEKLTTYEKSIANIEKFRLFAITAHNVRLAGADCLHKPIEDNYAHAEILGTNLNKTSSQLAKLSVFVHYPK